MTLIRADWSLYKVFLLLTISRYNILIMTALCPVPSIANVRNVCREKDVMWQFPRIKKGPNLAKSSISGNGKEEQKGSAAEGPHEHSTAAG